MVVWIERYNVHRLSLVKEGGMNIVVTWGSGHGYTVAFNGVQLKKDFPDLKEAKQAGLEFAEEVLEGAIAEIQEKRNHATI